MRSNSCLIVQTLVASPHLSPPLIHMAQTCTNRTIDLHHCPAHHMRVLHRNQEKMYYYQYPTILYDRYTQLLMDLIHSYSPSKTPTKTPENANSPLVNGLTTSFKFGQRSNSITNLRASSSKITNNNSNTMSPTTQSSSGGSSSASNSPRLSSVDDISYNLHNQDSTQVKPGKDLRVSTTNLSPVLQQENLEHNNELHGDSQLYSSVSSLPSPGAISMASSWENITNPGSSRSASPSTPEASPNIHQSMMSSASGSSSPLSGSHGIGHSSNDMMANGLVDSMSVRNSTARRWSTIAAASPPLTLDDPPSSRSSLLSANNYLLFSFSSICVQEEE